MRSRAEAAGRSGRTRAGAHGAAGSARSEMRAASGALTSDAIGLLEQDHRKVEALFERANADASVFDEIRNELEMHTSLEEEIFYPAAREALGDEGADLVEEARQEHEEVKALLQELSGMDREDAEYEEKLKVVQDNVEQHVQEEEGEMFPKMREACSPEQLNEMGSRMHSRKEELLGSLVPA
jgi:iron-sulfur cluster repair protein YtfE (RIC family)